MDIAVTLHHGLDWLPSSMNSVMKIIGSTVDFFAPLNWKVGMANSGQSLALGASKG